jgi:GNAT superfamily N-acetyltransferase
VINQAYVDRDLQGIMFWSVVTLVVFSLKGAATYGQSVILTQIKNAILANNQRRMFHKLMNESIGFFSQRHSSEFLAVPETARHSGLGTELLSRAEQIAKDRGCAGVWLDTYQFQAPDFYRKHGYQEFGRIADHPRGSQRLFFMKTF